MPRKSQFTAEQIIRALREVDAGAKPADVCRRLGVTVTTFHRWRSRFGGMQVNEAKRLRVLEDENAKLIDAWWRDYHEDRPHSSLGGLTPIEYERQHDPRPQPGTQTLV